MAATWNDIEKLLRSDAARVNAVVEQVDTDDLLPRIVRAMAAGEPEDLDGPGEEPGSPSSEVGDAR